MSTPDVAESAQQLLSEQISEWPMLRGGYESLNSIHTRSIEFDGFTITLQFNPGRIVSSTARTDAASIAQRRCFLCAENRPPEQRGNLFGDDWMVLCNPYPIFPEHFTVAHVRHTAQRIDGNFAALVDLAAAMRSRYVVLYNGPQSGASAPDHLHFQAGARGFMPIDEEYDRVKRPVSTKNAIHIYRSDPTYLRSFISFESPDRGALLDALAALYDSAQHDPPGDEPMVNIIASHEAGQWRVIIFPRIKHRPAFYFAPGDERILLSPAAVEMGGVCTLPIKRDFHRLTRDHVVQMYRDVCLAPDQLDMLCERVVEIV